MCYKKLFSITYEILGLLDNTLTGNYEYSRSNGENLRLPITSNYLKNYKVFAILFFHFWYRHEISNTVKKKKKKKEPHWSTASEVIDSEKCAYLNAK